MNMQQRNRNYVYTFIGIAIVSFVAMTIFILLNNHTFDKKVVLQTKITNALGIETHPSIVFKGFEIGRVTSFSFDDNLDVVVNFYVYEKYSNLISKKSVIHPVRNPLTGIIIDLYVFSSHKGSRGLASGAIIPSTELGRGRVMASNYQIKIKEPGVNEVVRRIDFLLKEIEDQNVVSNVGFVAQKLKDTVNLFESEMIKLQDGGDLDRVKENIISMSKRINKLVVHLDGLVGDFNMKGRSISSTVEKAENVLENANYLLEGINQNEFVNDTISPQKFQGEQGIKLND